MVLLRFVMIEQGLRVGPSEELREERSEE